MGRRPGSKNRKQEFSFPSSEENKQKLEDVFSKKADEITADAKEKKEVKKAVDELPEVFTPEQVAWAFHAYAGLLAIIFSFVLKTQFDKIYDELKFDESEALAMAKPLARVASKHAPSAWAGMTSEIELITTLGIWSVTAFKRAQNVAEKEKEKKRIEMHAPQSTTRPHDNRGAIQL